MARRLIWALPLLVIALALGIHRWAQRDRPATVEENSPSEVLNTPAAATTTDAPPSVSSPAETARATPAPRSSLTPDQVQAARLAWTALNLRIRRLGDSDDAELKKLYAESDALIHEREAALAEAFAQAMPQIVASNLEESFFAASSWARSAQDPTTFLRALWDYTPPSDPPTADLHHEALSPAVKHERLEVYSLQELRKRLPTATLDADQRSEIVERLVKVARFEKSLNLSIEAFKMLMAMDEQELVRSALADRSDRDRRLLKGVLGL